MGNGVIPDEKGATEEKLKKKLLLIRIPERTMTENVCLKIHLCMLPIL